MATEERGFITLDSIINDYIEESEQSIHKYAKLFNAAFRGMDDLGIDFFYQIKTIKLPVNGNKTADLPDDIIQYTKIGVLNNRGEIITLAQNNKLTTYADLMPNRQERVVDNTIFDYGQQITPDRFFNYWGGTNLMTLYGRPSGQPEIGSFKVDSHNGVIVLSPNFKYEYVMLEYIASPKEGEEYVIPIQFREALIAWLAWIDVRSLPTSRRGSLGDKRDRRSEYYNQRRLAINRYKPFRLEEAYQQNLQNQRKTVKA